MVAIPNELVRLSLFNVRNSKEERQYLIGERLRCTDRSVRGTFTGPELRQIDFSNYLQILYLMRGKSLGEMVEFSPYKIIQEGRRITSSKPNPTYRRRLMDSLYRLRLGTLTLNAERLGGKVTLPLLSALETHDRSTGEVLSTWKVAVDPKMAGQVGELPIDKVSRHLARDPEAFLARLSIVAEGATEVGFLRELLAHVLPGWKDLGVHIADGGGNDDALALLEALSLGGVKFGGFVDNENRDAGRWRAVKERVRHLVFQWEIGNMEQNVIPMFPTEQVRALIEDPADEKTGLRMRTLADRLETADATFDELTERARERLGAAAEQWNHPLIPWIVDAASGKVPDALKDAPPAQRNPFKGHASAWFKSVEGGHELARKVHASGVWDQQLEALLSPFFQAIVQTQAEPAPVARRAGGE